MAVQLQFCLSDGEPRAVTLSELEPHKHTINQHRTDSGPQASCQGAADASGFHPGLSTAKTTGKYTQHQELCLNSRQRFVNSEWNVMQEHNSLTFVLKLVLLFISRGSETGPRDV